MRNELSVECQRRLYKDHTSAEQPMVVVNPIIGQPCNNTNTSKAGLNNTAVSDTECDLVKCL